jgi:hypothetical protein
MASDARRKEKKRLKRKQKQQALRKAKLRTPLSRVASEGGRLECWVTDRWREIGIADILVLAHAPGGRCAFGAFLVDLWCVGLKDTWGEADITELEFRESMLERWQERTDGVKLDPAVAKRLVAGAVRFSRQNGFKLPSHWDRWVSIFGPLGNFNEADLSDFGKDGGQEYVGTTKFLRERLIGCTPEQFLTRPDVKWTMMDGMPPMLEELYEREGSFSETADDEEYEDADDEEEFDEDVELEGDIGVLREAMERMTRQLSNAVRKWCFANGRVPSPKLEEGAMVALASTIPAMPTDESDAVDRDLAIGAAATILDRFEPDERDQMILAMGQVTEFMKSFSSPKAMLAAVSDEPVDE